MKAEKIDMKENFVQVYKPRIKGVYFFKVLKELLSDARTINELGLRLCKRNIKSQYRQSVLGFLWVIIPPLLTSALWVFLNQNDVINVGVTDIPYPLFVLTGSMLWQIFTESVQAPIQSVNANRGLIIKLNFPREALILMGAYQTLFNLLPKVIVIGIAMALYSVSISWSLLLTVVGVGFIILTGFSVGLILTPIGILYNDVQRAIALGLPFIMYVSPIIYPKPNDGSLAFLMELNPFGVLFETTRSWITNQDFTIPVEYYLVIIGSSFLLLVGLYFFRVSMPIITERLGG